VGGELRNSHEPSDANQKTGETREDSSHS
jgi:hypothetical protein